MTEEADPTAAASGPGAAHSPDKRKKKSSKSTSKKQPSASSKSKSIKQKPTSSKTKGSNNKGNDPTVEGTALTSPEEHPTGIQPEQVTSLTAVEHADPEEFFEAREHEDAPTLSVGEEGKSTDAAQDKQGDIPGAACEGQETKLEVLGVEKEEEAGGGKGSAVKVEPQVSLAKRENSSQRPTMKRPRGPGAPALPAEAIPRTSINGICGGPWRTGASCSWMHDFVGYTCRREPGGPLPEKWSAVSDFLHVVDLRETAEKKQKGLLQVAETEEEQQPEEGGNDAVPFVSPNPLMVSKLLLLPCKTFLSTAFAPQLFRCRPFSPVGLQEQFDGAQRRKAGVGRRFGRGVAPPQHQQQKIPGGAEKREETDKKQNQEQGGQEQQEGRQREEEERMQQQVKEPTNFRPVTFGCECLIDEGRMRLLSVINLCLTERHYEPQLLRRDGLSVFWHKSQGGGEVPTAEGLAVYFKLLSLLTMQGLRTAEQWAAAADCATCHPGVPPLAKDAGAEGPLCKCNWRFTVVTHCTHGLNRTGYMVCALLMVLLGLSVAEAQRVFADARGRAIPRQEIVAALKQLEKEGASKALRGALEAPELDPVYVENAEADGVDLKKGSCSVRVAAAFTAEKKRTIPMMEGYKKNLTSYREAEKQRLIRAKQSPRKREQQQQQHQQPMQKEETKDDAEAGKTEGGKTEKSDGAKEDVAAKEVAGDASQKTASEVTLTEEELQQLPKIPSTIPNNGVVLFGPLSNALLAPEELIVYLLDLHQDLRVCDYRVLVSADVNSHMGYPQSLRKGNVSRRRRRVGVAQTKTKQDGGESEGQHESQEKLQQQPVEEQEEQKGEEIAVVKEEGGLKEGSGELVRECKPLELHYILYVQAANPFSFEKLLTADLVALRKQSLMALTLDFLPYLLARGKEMDQAAIKWSTLQPPKPRKGTAGPFLMGGGSPFPLPGFARPMPPPHLLGWMGPGGSRRGLQDGFGPSFLRGNGRPEVRGVGDFGRKPLGGGGLPPFRGVGPWTGGPAPPPPPPVPSMGQWKGVGGGEGPPPRFGRPRGGPENRPVPSPHGGAGQFEDIGRDPGSSPSARQGPPRDFYDAFKQKHSGMQRGGPWKQNPQGWRSADPMSGRPGHGGGPIFPKDNSMGEAAWTGNSWDGRSPQGASGAMPQGDPQWGMAPEADGPGARKRLKPSFGGKGGAGWNGSSSQGNNGGDWGGYAFKGSAGSQLPGEWSGPGRSAGGSGDSYGRGPPGGRPFRPGSAPSFNSSGTSQNHEQFEGARGLGMMPPQQLQQQPLYSSSNSSFVQQQPGGGTSPEAYSLASCRPGGLSEFSGGQHPSYQQQQQQQGYAYHHQQQQQGQQEPVPAYVMQLLQQQAAQRGASVDPQVLAQLYTQYYQSFLSSMSHSSGGQHLSQEQLMQYLQQMQHQQQQPAH